MHTINFFRFSVLLFTEVARIV